MVMARQCGILLRMSNHVIRQNREVLNEFITRDNDE